MTCADGRVNGRKFQTEPLPDNFTGIGTLDDVLLDSSGVTAASASADDQALANIMNGGQFYDYTTSINNTLTGLEL